LAPNASATPLLGFTWAGSAPVVVPVYDETHPRNVGMSKLEWRHFLRNVLHQWEASGAVDFRITRDKVGCSAMVHGVVMCDNLDPLTQAPYFTAGEMVDLDTIETGYVRYAAPMQYATRSYYRAILCHEFGHSLGLAHDPAGSQSCMSGEAAYPSDDEIATVQALYGVA
jgi:hypothetical protein